MISKDIVYALSIVQKELQKFNVHWAVIGSVALNLHGLNLTPKDLDIALLMDQVGLAHDAFLKHYAGKIDTGKGEKKFSVKLGNTKVDFIADPEVVSAAVKQNMVMNMTIDGMQIPIIELMPLKKSYERIGNTKKVKIIDDMATIQEFKATRMFPSDEFKKETILKYIIKDLESTKTYTGSELNSVISRNYGDFMLIKSELVKMGILKKDSYKDLYWIDKHAI